MSESFYFTWTPQNKAFGIPIKGVKEFGFLTEKNQFVYDLISTSFQTNFGYQNETIIRALKDQLDDFAIANPKAVFPLKTKVTEGLLSLLNLKGKIFYCSTGAEAVENAAKMARQIKNKKLIATRKKSYHGATLGALSLTGDWRNAEHFTVDDWTLRIPEPKDDPLADKALQVLEHHKNELAAVCLETITGANGVLSGSQTWWDRIQEFCKRENIFLICDEVLDGFYRTGSAFAFQRFHLTPDFVAMGKAISGGYFPLAAAYTSEAVSDYYEDHMFACGTTNYAHPLGLAALKGVLEIVNKPEFSDQVKVLENTLSDFIEKNRHSLLVREVRQYGLLVAMDWQKPVNGSKLFKKLFDRGFYVLSKDEQMILGPPLTISQALFKEVLDQFFEILKSIRQEGT